MDTPQLYNGSWSGPKSPYGWPNREGNRLGYMFTSSFRLILKWNAGYLTNGGGSEKWHRIRKIDQSGRARTTNPYQQKSRGTATKASKLSRLPPLRTIVLHTTTTTVSVRLGWLYVVESTEPPAEYDMNCVVYHTSKWPSFQVCY